MIKLLKRVRRETAKLVQKRPVIIELIPGTDRREAMVSLRLKGTRRAYRVTLSDLFRTAALWHANAERHAKAAARKQGIPWRQARKQFEAAV
jgi:hypothetical protein